MPKEKQNNKDIEFEEIKSEDEDRDIDMAPYKINTYGADFTLEILANKLEQREIIVPDFQRRYVWPEKKASRLIESFLLGLPVPQIFLYRTEDQNLLVVDGQQRLKSINYFLKGKFDDGRSFLLRNVKRDWEGKSFFELTEPDKRRIKNSVLRATIFEQTDPNDNTSMFEVFERLNTGGMALVEQEVRNCIVRGKINKFFEDLNQDKNWRFLLNKSEPDTRMRDIEMILRFFSLLYGWKKYKKPMKDFMTNFMKENKDLNKELKNEDGNSFREIMAFLKKEEGRGSFKLKSGINIALFDSISVALAEIDLNKIKNFKRNFKSLKSDSRYLDKISKSTTDIDRVQERIKIAIRSLSK